MVGKARWFSAFCRSTLTFSAILIPLERAFAGELPALLVTPPAYSDIVQEPATHLFWMGLGLIVVAAFAVTFHLRRRDVRLEKVRTVSEEKRRLSWALDQSECGVFDWNLDQQKVFVSARLMELLGHPDQDRVMDTQVFQTLVGPLYEKILPLFTSPHHTQEPSMQCDVELQGNDGLRLQVQYFPQSGGRGHVLGMALDITSEMRLSQQAEALSKLAKSLAQQTLAAEAASRSKARFLSDMSHELRTPLNAIIGFADMMERQLFGELGSPRYQDYCGDIQNSGRHLLGYIDAILEAARREGEDGLPCNAPVPLVQLFELALAGPLAKLQKQKNVQITADVQSDLVVYGDACALRELIDHMLTFAVERLQNGERISVRVKPLKQGIGIALSGPSGITDRCTTLPNMNLLAARALAEWQGGRLKTLLFSESVGVVYAQLPLRAIEPSRAPALPSKVMMPPYPAFSTPQVMQPLREKALFTSIS